MEDQYQREQMQANQQLGGDSRIAENVDRAMAKGALWMILARVVDRSIGLVSTVILVRLLAPADFGIIAMGMSIIAIMELFGQVGLEATLIQNRNASRSHYDTAWTFSVILSAIAAVMLLIAAVPAANFYREPRLLPILLVLAMGSLISGFENIGVVAFRKKLQFNKEFLFIFGKKLAGFLITVPLAFVLRSYWALIAGMIFGKLAGVGLSYYVQEYRPRWSLEARKELFHFSKWIVIFNAFHVLNSRGADFIIGKVAGAHSLGLFNVSYEISNLPTNELIAPINRAVFPAYALKSADSALLRNGYLDVLGMIATCGIPAGVGIAATSNWLVPFLLGQQWLEAIPLISVLAFSGILSAMQTNAYYVYLALGKPYIATYLMIVHTVLFLPILIVLTSRFGVIGTAYGYLLAQAVFTPISFSVHLKVLDISMRQIAHVLWRPVLAAGCMFAIIQILIPVIPSMTQGNLRVMQHFLAAVLVGTISYVSCLCLLWIVSAQPTGAESRILHAIRSTRIWSRLRTCQL